MYMYVSNHSWNHLKNVSEIFQINQNKKNQVLIKNLLMKKEDLYLMIDSFRNVTGLVRGGGLC